MNTTTAVFTANQTRATAQTALWQYDYGQLLIVAGLELPHSFQVHFCNEGDSTTTEVLGEDGVVEIPDAYLQTGKNINAFIYLHTGEDDGETECQITILVCARPQPTDVTPTPQEQSVIDQLITQLNEAVEAMNAQVQYVRSVADDITLVTIEDGIITFRNREDNA